MASISSPRFHSPSSSTAPSPNSVTYRPHPNFLSASPRRLPLPRFSRTSSTSSAPKYFHYAPCRCQSSGSDDALVNDNSGSKRRGWDSLLHNAVKAAVKRWEDYVRSLRNETDEGLLGGVKVRSEEVVEEEAGEKKVDWDWERWKRHFDEVEEQESIASILRSQLNDAVLREDYKDAAKLQRAIAAAVTNDVVGSAIKLLNKAIEEERYYDAAKIRDNAGTGLIGWWAGISEDSTDPHGRIIRITAEHGRYVARSYNPRQLASGRSGFPLFEIYFTVGDDGQYKQQAVYLKRKSVNSGKSLKKPPEPVNVENSDPLSGSSEEKSDLSVEEDVDIEESDNDSDISDGLAGIQNVLQDMIPGVKVKVLEVVSPGNVDRDLISKVIEQIMDEEDDDEDVELENVEPDDDLKTESDSEDVVDSGNITTNAIEGQSELSVKFVVNDVLPNLSVDVPPKDLVRVPAMLEKQDRFSFSFSIMAESMQNETDGKGHDLSDTVIRPPTMRSPELIMSDLAKVLTSRRRIPLKVLRDVGDLITLTVNQDQNQQPLYGKMFFNRINLPTSSDPLSGLYISARGMFSSEVLYLRRKFGQWLEDDRSQIAVGLEFYEYVEALKLTGDPSVPAGQVAFRAKVGKRNQLPHKGIIPEEFGVVARYKGQGRLAEPGFFNPRWVDGELVILDGKYIRGGPVIGFVYWAPEYHFLMFFNRLRLQN